MERLWVAAFEPVQRRPRRLNLQAAQLVDAVGLEAQLLNGHSSKTPLNPRSGTRDLARGDAGFIPTKRLIYKMVLQSGYAVVYEKPVLRSRAAPQFKLAVMKSGFDGIVQRIGETERRITIDKLARVGRSIDFSGHGQVGSSVEQDADIKKLFGNICFSPWIIENADGARRKRRQFISQQAVHRRHGNSHLAFRDPA